MRIMTMCILLLLPLCALVYANSAIPDSCNYMNTYAQIDTMPINNGIVGGIIYFCKSVGDTPRIFMTESKQYLYLKCDDFGWSGLQYKQLNSGEESGITLSANYKSSVSCVEYCVAQADEGVRITPNKKKSILNIANRNEPLSREIVENINQVECSDQTHALFNDDIQVENNNAKCDARGWYTNEQKSPFAENSKPQRFECRPATVTPEPHYWPPIPMVPQSCFNLRGIENDEKDSSITGSALTLNCLPKSRIFMVKSNRYWYLKCDYSGWYGLPYNLQKGWDLQRITDAVSILNVTCVESTVNPEPFTILTTLPPIVPPSSTKDIPKPCNIIRGVQSDQVVSERDGSKVKKLYCVEVGNTQKMIMIGSWQYESLSCDNSGWKGKPIGWKEGDNLIEIVDNNSVLTISCVDYTGEAPVTAPPPIKDICDNIRGVSLDDEVQFTSCYGPSVLWFIIKDDYRLHQQIAHDTTKRVECNQSGNAARNIFVGPIQYWFITCNEDGWKGAPIGWQDSSSLLVITNDEEYLTISCVEYCEAHGGEGVNITSKLTSQEVNYKYKKFSLKENFKRVECNDRTHSLFNNGEQVNSSHVECEARGWSNSALQKLPFDISKPQQFECRNAQVPTTTTPDMKDTTPSRNDPAAPTEAPTPSAAKTTEGPVAAAQSSLVIICASLGGILLLAIIIVAVICIMRSSKSKEPENVDNEMNTEIDVQMEDRTGSEHPEAESNLSEI